MYRSFEKINVFERTVFLKQNCTSYFTNMPLEVLHRSYLGQMTRKTPKILRTIYSVLKNLKSYSIVRSSILIVTFCIAQNDEKNSFLIFLRSWMLVIWIENEWNIHAVVVNEPVNEFLKANNELKIFTLHWWA